MTYTDEEILELIDECFGKDGIAYEDYWENALVDIIVQKLSESSGKEMSEKEIAELENAVLSAFIEMVDKCKCEPSEQVDKAISLLTQAKKISDGINVSDFDFDEYLEEEQKYFSGRESELEDFFESSELEDKAKKLIKTAIFEAFGLEDVERNSESAIESLNWYKATGDVRCLLKAYRELTLFDDGEAWL